MSFIKEKMKKLTLGTNECPCRKNAGSYYNPLPWTVCSKMPSLVSNENDMCDIDAGKECRFVKVKGG